MEHKEQRQPGFYHILVNRYDHNTDSYTPEWIVGYWHNGSFYNWQGFQSEERFSEICKEIPLSDQHEVVIEVDENRIERHEPINLSEFASKIDDIISDCKETGYSWDGENEVPYDTINSYESVTGIIAYLKEKRIINGN